MVVTVLQEILEWSHDRPVWQRDALRRLVLNGELSDDDIEELTSICKAAYGLTEQRDFTPLTADDLPVKTAGNAPVSLLSIFHHRGVNALAEDQTLKFGPNLTVVYGDNAAGKSGYIRILKSACRARSQERILGNVVSGTTPFSPVVSIKYKVGAELQPREWTGEGEDEFISRVSVFDTQCAVFYLTEKADVAFRHSSRRPRRRSWIARKRSFSQAPSPAPATGRPRRALSYPSCSQDDRTRRGADFCDRSADRDTRGLNGSGFKTSDCRASGP